MTNIYLLNEAIDTAILNDFKVGISELILVKEAGEDGDNFWKHDSIYALLVMMELWGDPSIGAKNVSIFIEQLRSYHPYLADLPVLDGAFPGACNAFMGFDFSVTAITADRQVSNTDSFVRLKHTCLWGDVSFKNLWDKRDELFPELVLCGEVEQQVGGMGDSALFSQILEKLKVMNTVAKKWTAGDFSYRATNREYPVNISPESEQTIKNYGNLRKFSLPDKSREIFDLHIKTGDLRFHFYPDNKTRKIYIGYIGPHLKTWTN